MSDIDKFEYPRMLAKNLAYSFQEIGDLLQMDGTFLETYGTSQVIQKIKEIDGDEEHF